jgi:glycyl-tRNA synthetase beta chain
MNPIARCTFLLEVGVEEIPARMAPPAAAQLGELLASELANARLGGAEISTFVTPRRLIALARGVPERQEDRVVEKRGPAVTAAFGADGAPTKAGQGFARSQGLQPEQLGRMSVGGTEYVVARKEEKGEETLALLPALCQRVLGAMKFPKTMRWGALKQAFVRPVHWILALLDARVVPFEFAAIASSNVTYGHRFMGKRGPLPVANPNEYARLLSENFVMFSPEERKRRIREKTAGIEKELGLTAVWDDDLLEEVAHLVEFPVVAHGRFDERFLAMPPEVLITAMKNHQKYFAVRRPDGQLSNHFIVVSNTKALDRNVVVRGNQRVLAARLSDALFFFKEDQKKPLPEFVASLAGQTFLAGLGSMKEKTERIANLAEEVANRLGYSAAAPVAQRAGRLAKADLACQMVGEFPELQGIMGSVYALACGESAAVSAAIREHYLPRQAGGPLPESEAGIALALADRLDTVVGCFHLGLVPTATKDPYALRRASLAGIRILADKKVTVPFSALLEAAIANYGGAVAANAGKLLPAIQEFVVGRLRSHLAADHATEVVDACLAAGSDFPYDVQEKCKAVEALRGREDYASLITAFKRVLNILGKETGGSFQPALAQHPSETALWDAFLSVRERAQARLTQRSFGEVLALLVELRPPIDRYFDDVLVMCEEAVQRENHLAMLAEVGRFFLRFADFTKILV